MPLSSNAESLQPPAPNVEYFREYEMIYLTECTKRDSAFACQRAMEQLQKRIGFFEFATVVSTDTFKVVAASN